MYIEQHLNRERSHKILLRGQFKTLKSADNSLNFFFVQNGLLLFTSTAGAKAVHFINEQMIIQQL